jgi:hypothetical protein
MTGRKWDISKRFKDFIKFENKLVKSFSEAALAGVCCASLCPLYLCVTTGKRERERMEGR